ncbi:MAG: glutamate racemase [Candidatus Omnitrophica bacterium]|nr:glutamate racemase [Candidatus Omnitrophota bacterium]MBU1047517.1 glutamate racemase [Candidatus Omnitrophota bacterium]MBU1631159.1 glutamate racemase [Candidatus Omnitrophota bacterium]MBU1767486.1 glutamate racemase [Candidatus Omnitrophota bacterium]MBU1888880.1 glutamate racemase [Candidatus Omnitrophota bacterium]
MKTTPLIRNSNSPIGMFDSGVGGLTLLKSIKRILPNEQLIYFGDTARLPYGTKSPKVVQNFSLQIAKFLVGFKIKSLVIACHTASSAALSNLKIKLDIPVIGVIEPSAQKAVTTTKNQKIGVIGTKTTIESGSYQSFIQKINPKISITTVAAPLLVPLVEEGWVNKGATRIILKEYVAPFKKAQIDTLILGCTHYPLIKQLFRRELGPKVFLIDASIETALYLKKLLNKKSLINNGISTPDYRFYVSDDPDKFSRLAQIFLGEKIEAVKPVDLENWGY